MKKTTIIALLLAIATFLCAFAGCGKKKTPDPTPDTVVTDNGTGSAGEDSTSGELPDRTFQSREYRILGRDGDTYPQFSNFEFEGERNNELISEAVYTRNRELEAKYKFLVTYKASKDVAADVRLYSATDDLYDLVVYRVLDVQTAATEGLLANLNDVPWLNFSQPCWNLNANSSLSLANRLYYTTSDYLLLDKNRTYLNIYNRELARRYNLGQLEDLVDAGTWAYDKFFELQTTTSVELDGLDGHSSDDGFGLVMDSYNAFAAFAYGGGFLFSDKNEQDLPQLVAQTSNITSIIDKTLQITCDKEKAMFCNDYNNDWAIANNTFYASRALVTTTFLSVFDTSMREQCTFEYGFLPFPKYDANQEFYYTIPDPSHSQVFAIPEACRDKDFAGYMLELFSEVSTDTTMKTYYETKCKLRNSYDELCAKMLDLIFEHVVYDSAFIGNFGNLRSILTTELPQRKMAVYTGLYRGRSGAAGNEIAELVEKYESFE